MRQVNQLLKLQTNGKYLLDLTNQINNFIVSNKFKNGLLNISILHTSCSLLIQENADPSVLDDLISYFNTQVPEDFNYSHNSEGKDDMPAHIKSALTQSNLSLSIIMGEVMLGNWQGIYLFEHRTDRKNRKVLLHYLGE